MHRLLIVLSTELYMVYTQVMHRLLTEGGERHGPPGYIYAHTHTFSIDLDH